MFVGCSQLTTLNLSTFNTQNVLDMEQLFRDCNGLTSLNVSNFNISNVINMTSMFRGCSSLTNLNLSNFNTSNVRDMSSMFDGCSGLANLNLSQFDIGLVVEKGYMCRNLSTTSGECTITCPPEVEDAIKEVNPNYDPDAYEWEQSHYYYLTGLPTSGVTFIWQRPSSSK